MDDQTEPPSSPAPANASAPRSPRRCSATAGPCFAHVHHDEDEVPERRDQGRRRPRRARLRRRDLRGRRGLPPVRLLVNNAARFAWDGFGEFSATNSTRTWRSTSRAPALLIDQLARRSTARAMRWSSTCSIRSLPRPTPIISAILCRSRRWPALTELAARALAPRSIRVNGIAPGADAAIERPERGEFRGDARDNPLRRGVEPEDVVAALALPCRRNRASPAR